MAVLNVTDATGATIQIPAEGTNGAPTPHSAPEIGGLVVSGSNPMPTTNAAVQAAIGTINDATWTGTGTATMIALLRGLFGQTLPSPLTDKTILSTTANASQSLVGVNPSRNFLSIYAPSTAGISINLAGGTASGGTIDTNGAGCIFLPAGGLYEMPWPGFSSAVSYYCTTAGLQIVVLEG